MALKYQTALVGTTEGTVELSHSAPAPNITGDMILVKTKAISVDPVDTKIIGPYVTAGAIAGFDFAGVVESVGPDASMYGISVGDRVCAAILGMNPLEPAVGAFSEHAAAMAWAVLKLGPVIGFDEGASLSTSFMTAGMALFKSLGLPGDPLRPSAERLPVLVYGGSTATGTAAIQLLNLAGFEPLATCSPHNFDLVKSYGAAAVWDYAAAGSATEIRARTRNELRYAMDCITTTASMQF